MRNKYKLLSVVDLRGRGGEDKLLGLQEGGVGRGGRGGGGWRGGRGGGRGRALSLLS